MTGLEQLMIDVEWPWGMTNRDLFGVFSKYITKDTLGKSAAEIDLVKDAPDIAVRAYEEYKNCSKS